MPLLTRSYWKNSHLTIRLRTGKPHPSRALHPQALHLMLVSVQALDRKTMKSRFAAMPVLLFLVTGCASISVEPRPDATTDLIVRNDIPLENDSQSLVFMHPEQRPGKWIEKNGSRICDGYLTSNASIDFCSSTVPDEWRSFTFDGTEYYFQQLAYE